MISKFFTHIFVIEADLLWSYEDTPCNSYVAEVQDVVFLESGAHVFAKGGLQLRCASHQRPFLPDLDDESHVWSAACVGVGNVHRGTARSILQAWLGRLSPDMRQLQMACVSIVSPVVSLIRVGDWKHIVFMSQSLGWRECVDPWLPVAFAQQVRPPGRQHIDLSKVNLTPELMRRHIGLLRHWAPHIIRADPSAEQDLEEQVEEFERISIALLGGGAAVWEIAEYFYM